VITEMKFESKMC